MNALMQHGGLDWAAIALSWAAIHQLGHRRRNGFAFFILANVCWIVFGLTVGSPALLVGNTGFLVNNVLGYLRWAPPPVGQTSRSVPLTHLTED